MGTTALDNQWLIDYIDLSLEFLMGRALDNAMLNVGMKEAARGKKYISVASRHEQLLTYS